MEGKVSNTSRELTPVAQVWPSIMLIWVWWISMTGIFLLMKDNQWLPFFRSFRKGIFVYPIYAFKDETA
jgi:hypothetical protein